MPNLVSLCSEHSGRQASGISARIRYVTAFRSWLQVVGTPFAVEQKLMRHADIRTTMNTYKDTFQPELADAASKVAGLVLNGAQTERKPS